MRISKTTVMVKESDTLIDLRIKKSNYFFICESYCFLVETLEEFIGTGIVLSGIHLDIYFPDM